MFQDESTEEASDEEFLTWIVYVDRDTAKDTNSLS